MKHTLHAAARALAIALAAAGCGGHDGVAPPVQRPSTLTILDHDVIAADYSPATGMLVTVSDAPARLNVIDPETGSEQRLPLPKAPTAVRLGPDGAFAAVGHDSLISYVDLRTGAIVGRFAVPITVRDVVLPGDGWIYAFPVSADRSRVVDLATGEVRELAAGTGLGGYDGDRAVADPSGRYLYVPTFTSPDDLLKWDLTTPPGKPLYYTRFGRGDIGWRVWMSVDGSRIFTHTGLVLWSATSTKDMTLASWLGAPDSVDWVADSPAAGRIYAIPSAAPGSLRAYDAGNHFLGDVALPGFPAGGVETPAIGRYVFASRGGASTYVLAEEAAGVGSPRRWALVAFDRISLP